nr:uncharacterized protein LOC129270188 [Lytechinus pictus]
MASAPRTLRWCIVCNRELVTCKHYSCLNSVKARKPNVKEQVDSIFGDLGGGEGDTRPQYICDKCVAKVLRASKLDDLRKELCDQLKKTKEKHRLDRDDQPASSSLPSTPVKPLMASVRPKRPAVCSPGTPSTKHPSKRVSSSPRHHSQISSQRRIHFNPVNESAPALAERSSLSEHPSRRVSSSPRHHSHTSQRRVPFNPVNENAPTPAEQSSLSEVVIYDDITRRGNIPSTWTGIASALYQGDEAEAVSEVLKLEEVDKKVQEMFLSKIKKEAEDVCKVSSKSSFRDSSLSAMMSFDIKEQEKELLATAPTLMSVLQTAATPQRSERNVRKTKESLTPRVLSSASILLNSRNQNMNANQVVNSLVLKEGAAKKPVFKRLNTKGVCTSYDTALKVQMDYGKNYDEKVRDWAKIVDRDNREERRLQMEGFLDAYIAECLHRELNGYQLLMDNVDLVIQARHPTRTNYGKDLHMVHMMAVEHRVHGHHLPNAHPVSTIDSVDTADFLPNLEDNKMLRRDWMILSARIIGAHIPSLSSAMSTFPSRIQHEHMEEMRSKSNVVNLGVLMENENSTDGIIKIVRHMHQYCPGDDTDHPSTILSAGDLLTCERMSSCIEQQRNSTSPSGRLEGLMPVIADFHALANFYQVIWKQLYDAASGADKGTLYSARNFLEARNVTTNPMANINAAADLIEKYTTSLVLAAAMQYFGLADLTSDPTLHTFDLTKHGDQHQYAEATMSEFVDEFMLPKSHDMQLTDKAYHCPKCNKTYATRKGLVNHERNTCHDTPKPPTAAAPQQDSVVNYTKCALGMGMLALDFTDARQLGDGGRIIRLYKFLLLHCKAGNKPKYSFQILRLLAQVQCLLTPRLAYELIWNRTLNTKGKADTNTELDRAMEHHNRIFKEHAQGLHGKVTQKSVDRISRSAQAVNEVLANIDQQQEVKKASSKRQKTGKEDVASLAVELHQERIFEERPGRSHSRFPDFPVSVLNKLSSPELHRWISASLKMFSRQHQFAPH